VADADADADAGSSVRAWFEHTDAALYRAKPRVRNQSATMDTQTPA
jgi:hypothetical protein